jgi:SNF2 family DNA or RNA helicase
MCSFESTEEILCDCVGCLPLPAVEAAPAPTPFFCFCEDLLACNCDCVKGDCCEVHSGECASVVCGCWLASAKAEAAKAEAHLPLWPGFSYKPHQETAISWMLARESSTPSGGLLCDEMGLGKTMEILGIMKNSPKIQTLLLCPKAVVAQWRTAAQRSHFNVLELQGAGWRLGGSYRSGQPFLFITNYEKLVAKTGNPFGRSWDRVVLDEAQRVRNKGSKVWSAIAAMKRKTTWCVSATPIVNGVKDIKALFSLVGYEKEQLASENFLYELMNTACLHRSMEEMRPILSELPSAPIITKEYLDFDTEEESEFYRGIQGVVMRRWRAVERDEIKMRFALIMRLRQISLHPQVYINARKKEWSRYARQDWSGPSTKFNALRRKLEGATDPARWIVFCQFHDEMDMLQAALEKSPAVGLVQLYHGGMTDKAKDAVIAASGADRPIGDKHEVLLVQLQSGGVGLNLQHFNKIVFMSPWWTSALMDQAIGRAVRIGQKEVVEVTMLVLKEEETMNIDRLMLEKVDEKRCVLANLFLHASRGLGEVQEVQEVQVLVKEGVAAAASAAAAEAQEEEPTNPL